MKLLPYQDRLTKAVQLLRIKPGAFLDAHVEHDLRCPVMNGRSICCCSPNVIIDCDEGRIEVLPDGSIRRSSRLN